MYTPRATPPQASPTLRQFLDDELERIAYAINNPRGPGVRGSGLQVGSGYGFHDIIGSPQQPLTGSGRPTFAQIGTTGVYAWSFSTGDDQFYVWHLPHDYLPGSDIYFHVHWFGSQTAGGYTRWEVEYLYASGHDTDAFPTSSTTVNVQQQQNTTAWQHMIAETDAVTISDLAVDGIIVARVGRIAPVGQTDVSGDVFAPIMDIHYQSTNVATPNRSPNFYAERGQ